MLSFKKSFAAIVAISLLVVAIAALLQPAGAASPDKGPRKFYLTQTFHKGGEPLFACADGYHMASLWEIFDTSNLRYNTELGQTTDDSGSGPPRVPFFGWIRTGAESNGSNEPGTGNCNAWTTSDSGFIGTVVALSSGWNDAPLLISPWNTGTHSCFASSRVWCVQD